jgi:hypothetical protein
MKEKIYPMFVVLSLCFICIQQGHAQETKPLYSKGLSFGMNSEAFTGLELGCFQESSISDIPSYYYINMNIPLLSSIKQKKLDTWELKAGTQLELIRRNRWMMFTDFSLFSIRHTQSLGTFMPLGFNLKITSARMTKNGYIGFQSMFKQVLFTHITHSDYVKEKYDEIYDADNNLLELKPQNGFYLFTGNQLYYGIEGAFNISSNLDMYFDLGLIHYFSKFTGFFDAMMFGQIPFYMHLQLNYKLGKR